MKRYRSRYCLCAAGTLLCTLFGMAADADALRNLFYALALLGFLLSVYMFTLWRLLASHAASRNRLSESSEEAL